MIVTKKLPRTRTGTLYVDKNKVKQKVSKLVINTISNLMTYASEMKPSRIQKDLEANF